MSAALFGTASSLVTAGVEQLALGSGGRIEYNADPVFLRAADARATRRVGLVSGGGSGHEPLHSGFLGPGGLDAVAPGAVFASPHNRRIWAAARAAAREDGVLLIVKNYTGDRINFSIAAERLRHEGIPVATVLVDDDIASSSAGIGGRGTAATVLVELILGAAADRGAGLAELAALGARAVAAGRSIGVAFRAQTLPGSDEPAFALDGGVVEYGVGIHGERGAAQMRVHSLDGLVERMLGDVLAPLAGAEEVEEVVLLVNNLGGLTDLETAAVANAARAQLRQRGVRLAMSDAGRFCTALDMRGFSLTLMRADPEFVELLRGDHRTVGLPRLAPPPADHGPSTEEPQQRVGAPSPGLDRLLDDVRRSHALLTELDRRAGDGDFGDNLLAGVAAAASKTGPDLDRLAAAFLDDVGGTSGPLFGLLFQQLGDANGSGAEGLGAAAAAIARVGDAREGDRTLLDALLPAAAAASEGPEAMVLAAIDGAIATAGMTARRGRATYLDDRVLGAADAGAVGVVVVLQSLAGTGFPIQASDFGATA